MSDLANLSESLKRRVAVPGDFADLFPNTTDDDVVGVLMDGFARAQLDGYFGSVTATDAGILTPDITRPQGSLIVLYGGVLMVQTQLLNLKNKQRYVAGPVQYETEQSASILTAILKQLNDEKVAIATLAARDGATAAFTMADMYFIKAVGTYPGFDIGLEFDRAYDYSNPWGSGFNNTPWG